jgi:hypothetical protein
MHGFHSLQAPPARPVATVIIAGVGGSLVQILVEDYLITV